jgi:hypothetical protein
LSSWVFLCAFAALPEILFPGGSSPAGVPRVNLAALYFFNPSLSATVRQVGGHVASPEHLILIALAS